MAVAVGLGVLVGRGVEVLVGRGVAVLVGRGVAVDVALGATVSVSVAPAVGLGFSFVALASNTTSNVATRPVDSDALAEGPGDERAQPPINSNELANATTPKSLIREDRGSNRPRK
jgi:hypothetical protein